MHAWSQLVAHGWNIDFGGRREPAAQYSLRGWKRCRQDPATCTLLGPEGPGLEGDLETRFLGPRSDRLERTLRSRRQERYRPYVENYTVDASILELRSEDLISTIKHLERDIDHWSQRGAFELSAADRFKLM